MLERQIVNLAKAVLLLHTIKADKSRLDLVVELQRFLIRRNTQCERRTYRVNQTLVSMRRSLSRDRLPKTQAMQVKMRIKDGADVIEILRHMMFLWRSFGDGILGSPSSAIENREFPHPAKTKKGLSIHPKYLRLNLFNK